MIDRIDGVLFKKMVTNGLNNLINNETEINSMNVFPVADGDTGTNMRLTLQNGVAKANSNEHLGAYLKELSQGMILGARGNSGVILSQLFKGLASSLSRYANASPEELRNAYVKSYRVAYAAVMTPVEGTILTVAKDGIENCRRYVNNRISMKKFFLLFLDEMKKALYRTPDQLAVLKEAGVLDSGGKGYVVIVDGMYRYLMGEVISPINKVEISQNTIKNPIFFGENSNFQAGYCTEFIMQLLNNKNYKETFNINEYINEIKPYGNSIVAFQENTIVKVHIHTLCPEKVIAIARKYGEFINFKMENMEMQHNEFVFFQEKMPHKPISFIAVVDGKGIDQIYKDMGVDIVIQGGPTMNTSSEEFVTAIKRLDADKIVIFPNNKNILEAARQAVSVSKLDNIEIIPTESVLEGYYAMAMDMPDDSIESRVEALKDGAQGIVSITVGTAIKNFKSDEFSCNVNDKVSTINGKMVTSALSISGALDGALSHIEDIEDRAALIILTGENFEKDKQIDLEHFIKNKYSNLEVQFFDGGQHTYDLVVGVI